MTTLRVILHDQLSLNISSLRDADKKSDIILICELAEDCTYAKHHKKKLVFILSAMRHFAAELKQQGHNVRYVKLDDPDNCGILEGEIIKFSKEFNAAKIVITWPSEYRVLEKLQGLKQQLNLDIRDDDRFLCGIQEFADWSKNRKELRMEFFYRQMRQKHGVLMSSGKPEGGKWNYDALNRKFPHHKLDIPKPYSTEPDQITHEVVELVARKYPEHFGDIEPLYFAVTREGALEALELFIKQRLKNFGDYQDAMLQNEPWMYHAHISFYLNIGLLEPLECLHLAETAYRLGHATLSSVEGFVRQILGWREYVRGIYWLKMPEYKQLNFLDATRKLPEFYWSGDTKMNCLAQCVNETKRNAYAHHIQRLMVLGNFALLAGIHPDFINEWYLIVYLDAYEWVELPNVTGMILFADGGYLGSKPYAASGAYINKMSNYCKGCEYNVEEKSGKNACPFNYLYWHFLLRNRDKLSKNQRMSMVYAVLSKMDQSKIDAICRDSENFFTELDNTPYGS